MKHIIEIIILIAVIVSIGALTGCTPEEETTDQKPAETTSESKDAVKARVADERELREEAENRAEEEAGHREFWETLGVLALLALGFVFITGTALGSRGRRHAGS